MDAKLKTLFIASLFFCSNAFAGTISISPFISGNDVTIAHLESQRSTLQTVINGNIEGGTNIKAGSLLTADFSNAVSPVTRWDEAFNDWTYTGMLPSTDSDLTSDISAGTSYVGGYRVVIGTTSHTYTASKDTYVYVHQGGYYVYQEVANGASAPSTPANTLYLAKVVTDGTTVSSVTDARTTGITLASGANIVPTDYRKEMYVYQASSTTITVAPGVIDVGGTRVAKTSATTLTLTTASDWAGGSSLQAANTTGYVGIDSSGNIKMHTTAPTHSNSGLSVTAGTKRYVSWSSTTYRVIGWFRMNGVGSGQLYAWGASNISDGGVRNYIRLQTGGVQTGTTVLPYDDTIPQNTEGDQYLSVDFVPSNTANFLRVRALAHVSSSADQNQVAMALFQDSTANALAVGALDGGGANEENTLQLEHLMPAGTVSSTTFKIRIGGDGAGTTTVNGDGGAGKYGGKLATSLSVEEIEEGTTS